MGGFDISSSCLEMLIEVDGTSQEIMTNVVKRPDQEYKEKKESSDVLVGVYTYKIV